MTPPVTLSDAEALSLDRLEWPALHRRLMVACWSIYGEDAWESPWLAGLADAQAHLADVGALMTWLIRFGLPPLGPAGADARPALKRLARGGTLALEDWHALRAAVLGGDQLLTALGQAIGADPRLETLTPWVATWQAQVARPIVARLTEALTDTGELNEQVFPSLSGLRRRLRQERQQLTATLERMTRKPEVAQALQSTLWTERDGRLVLPVRAGMRSLVPGMVHAGSGSGATVFVEPEAVVALNNRIQATLADLEAETGRILDALSEEFRPEAEALQGALAHLGQLDRRLAAAELGRQLSATVPTLRPEGRLNLHRLRHPLLVLKHRETGHPASVIPNDLALGDDEQRTLIVTGPNTGGKTVLLKTVGLLALMVRAGLPIPVAEGSEMGWFQPVLAELGDAQNLAADLSTFSGRIARFNTWLTEALPSAAGPPLILVDELGSGTDPVEATALAEALLGAWHAAGALTVVTTHLGGLALYAHEHPGFENASMAFDPDALAPSYRLVIGTPGTSHAIRIAERLGLPADIVAAARQQMAAPARDAAALLEHLEHQRLKLAEDRHAIEAHRKAAEESYAAAERLRAQLTEQRRTVVQQFRSQLKGRLAHLQGRMDLLEERIASDEQRYEAQAKAPPPERVDKSRSQLRRLQKETLTAVTQMTEKVHQADRRPAPVQLAVGDTVRSRRLGLSGTVVAIQGDELTLQAGAIRMSVALSEVDKLSGPGSAPATGKTRSAPSPAHSRTHAPTPEKPVASGESWRSMTECDVRGRRVDEAVERVEQFLDQALLAGFDSVGIIHGIGSGAVRDAIRAYLKTAPHVDSFGPAEAIAGGDGKTVVRLLGDS